MISKMVTQGIILSLLLLLIFILIFILLFLILFMLNTYNLLKRDKFPELYLCQGCQGIY